MDFEKQVGGHKKVFLKRTKFPRILFPLNQELNQVLPPFFFFLLLLWDDCWDLKVVREAHSFQNCYKLGGGSLKHPQKEMLVLCYLERVLGSELGRVSGNEDFLIFLQLPLKTEHIKAGWCKNT